jgi:hypothetical protein
LRKSQASINPYIYDDYHHLDSMTTDERFINTPHYNGMNFYFGVNFDDMENDYQYNESSAQCIRNGFSDYMNREDVRKAIHIPERIEKWINCKDILALNSIIRINTRV